MEPTALPHLSPLPNSTSPELADDLLRGADAIAEFIFGARGSRRKIYYLAETSHLPVFRLGAQLRAGCNRILSGLDKCLAIVKDTAPRSGSAKTQHALSSARARDDHAASVCTLIGCARPDQTLAIAVGR